MKRISTASILFITFLYFLAPTVYAEEDNLGYTVNLVRPKTQINPKSSYFYIETVPEEQQTLEVRVKSTRKAPISLNIYQVNAITGDGGTIEYSEDLSLSDPTLKDPLTSMVEIDTPTLKIGNFEEKTINIKVTPPNTSYDGIKMGAIVFEVDDKDEPKNGVTMGFSYRIGLITSESGSEFNNGKTLKLTNVEAAIKRGKKMVLAGLQNPEPKVLENLTIQATMIDKETKKVIKRKTVEEMSMAPNSQFDFELDWGIEEMPSGTYMLTLDVANDYEDWSLEKEFTITNQQAKKLNEASAFKIITPKWIKVSTISLYALVTVVSVLVIIRRRTWKKMWKKSRRKKSKGKK